MIREIDVAEITSAIAGLFVEANRDIRNGTLERLQRAVDDEQSLTGKEVLRELVANAELACEKSIPLCQDTGLAVVFAEIGQDIHFVGGDFGEAVAMGVLGAYRDGYLRKSCCHPFTRDNTGNNLPPILHTSIVPGSSVKIIVMPKGGGSENYSEVRMLTPAQGIVGVKDFVVEMVRKGGPNPCPPVTVGVGIGGNFEMSAFLSKKALMTPYGVRNGDPDLSRLEEEILGDINSLGIGPGGYGGTITALDVHVKMMPCHIASLPVAVNIQCHAHRIREVVL
jgi:fumarate hydratase subunit alpha